MGWPFRKVSYRHSSSQTVGLVLPPGPERDPEKVGIPERLSQSVGFILQGLLMTQHLPKEPRMWDTDRKEHFPNLEKLVKKTKTSEC